MKYVGLLRGVNVGGKAKVEMPKLKRVFESLGYTEVKTYINSGNVIFSANTADIELLKNDIEAEIQKDFGFAVSVLIRTADQIIATANALPKDWLNNSQMKCDVMFLWDEIDNPNIMQKIAINQEIEDVLYLPGILIWRIDRQHVTRGGGIKLIKTDLYKYMTVRNCNTVRKLAELC